MEEQESKKRSADSDLIPVLVKLNCAPENDTEREANAIAPLRIHINKENFKIGRSPTVDESILSVFISRTHCVLNYDKECGNWTINNLSSTDTLLNDEKLERNVPHNIKENDIIQLSGVKAFRYKMVMEPKDSIRLKHPRTADAGSLEKSSQFGNVIMKQKNFIEYQKNERKDLENQITEKHQEQEKLRGELQKLLQDQSETETCNKLNAQIAELQNKIEIGNQAEYDLKTKYKELLEMLNEERRKFGEEIAMEKEKWQKALKESKQEKEKLEMTMVEQMEEWRIQQQEEWDLKTENLLQEGKNVQSTILNEKKLLEQRLKEVEDTLKENEEKLKKQEEEKILMEQKAKELMEKQSEQERIILEQQERARQELQEKTLKEQQSQEKLEKQILAFKQEQAKSVMLEKQTLELKQQQAKLVEDYRARLMQEQRVKELDAKAAEIHNQKLAQSSSKPNILRQSNKYSHLPVEAVIDLTKSTDTETRKLINQVSNIMDEQLTCSICSEYFVQAVSLQCSHTYCLYCIQSWKNKSNNCPQCRAIIISWSPSLVVDNFIETMLQSFTPEQMEKRRKFVIERKRATAVPIKVVKHKSGVIAYRRR